MQKREGEERERGGKERDKGKMEGKKGKGRDRIVYGCNKREVGR